MTERDPDEPAPTLTRELLLSGALSGMLSRAAPGLRALSEEDRARSLRETMARRPPPVDGDRDGGVWLFAYGSLIWNPTIAFDDRRIARVDGWHRAFCLSAIAGRGTLEAPGLLLGLDLGGECVGAALHVAPDSVATELDVIWRREMLTGVYHPRWLALRDPEGAVFAHGIAFTIDRDNAFYCGGLARAEIVRRLATASGEIGTSAEYLFRTRDGLRALGIRDDGVEDLADAVAGLAERGA